jgi:hypothetical protein
MMNVEVGMKVIANYGAMHADVYGVVTEIHPDGWVVFRDANPEREILNVYNVRIENIRNDFENPKGSPIGVFANPYEV